MTNSQGQAVVDLTQRSYTLRVAADGFKFRMITPLNIDPLKGSEQTISVVLQIGERTSGPCCIEDSVDLPTTPIEVSYSLPLEPLQEFPLHSVRPHRHLL